MIKQLEPQLNKKNKPFVVHETQAQQEADQIVNKFEAIFQQEDVQPTIAEKRRMDEEINAIKAQMIIVSAPPFMMREIQLAVKVPT